MKRFISILFFIPLFASAQHFGTTQLEVREFPILQGEDSEIKNFLNSYPEIQLSNKEEWEWFYWTDYSRANPKRFWDSLVEPTLKIYPELKGEYANSLKKDLYSTSALPLLKPSSFMKSIAQEQASALAVHQAKPSHSSPDGSSFQDRMTKANVRTCVGENISFGPANIPFALVLLYLDEGVPSLGHRKALLNPSYVEMGVGISYYPNNMVMSIQDFACATKQ